MIGIIIQARMGSSRFPGKVLAQIGDKTLLGHIIHRLTYLKEKDIKIIVATSTNSIDDIIEQYCINNNITCYRGSETNVLSRYYDCAKLYNFKHIVRLTADNPFVDVFEIDRLIELHIKTNSDYTNSFENLPYGVGCEIFTFNSLERDYNESSMPHHFEHVNEYILENPDKFKCTVLKTDDNKNKPEVRLTVDTREDYDKACYIVNKSNSDYITTEEAIKICSHYV